MLNIRSAIFQISLQVRMLVDGHVGQLRGNIKAVMVPFRLTQEKKAINFVTSKD